MALRKFGSFNRSAYMCSTFDTDQDKDASFSYTETNDWPTMSEHMKNGTPFLSNTLPGI